MELNIRKLPHNYKVPHILAGAVLVQRVIRAVAGVT